jgi:hypothetical protein
MGVSSKVSNSLSLMYRWADSNRHEHYYSRDFKSLVSTISPHRHFRFSTCQRTFLSLFYYVKIRNKFDFHKLYFQTSQSFLVGVAGLEPTNSIRGGSYSPLQLPLCDTPFGGAGGIRTHVLIRKPNLSFTSLVYFS